MACHETSWVIPGLVIIAALLLTTGGLLPTTHRGGESLPQSEQKARRRLGPPIFIRCLLSAGFIQVSHSALIAVGSVHWRTHGVEASAIGWLWAEAVAFEVILFSSASWVFRRYTPRTLLAWAAVAAVVRWCALGATTHLGALVLAQALHGLTFGATHLATMEVIRNNVEPDATATATAWYGSVVMGVGFGIGLPIAGVLYDHWGAAAYLCMTVLAVLGGLMALKVTPTPSLQVPSI